MVAAHEVSVEREALWARLEKSTFLTPNEKRSAVGCGLLDTVSGHSVRPSGSDTVLPPILPVPTMKHSRLIDKHPEAGGAGMSAGCLTMRYAMTC